MKDVADQFLELAEKISPAPAIEDVRKRAEAIWQNTGGDSETNWIQAERQFCWASQ